MELAKRHKSVVKGLLKRWRAERDGAPCKRRSQPIYDKVIGLSLNARVRIAAALFGRVEDFCHEFEIPDEHVRERPPSLNTISKVVAYLDAAHHAISESAFKSARLSIDGADADPVTECFVWFLSGHLPLRDALDLLPKATFHEDSKGRSDLLDEVARFLDDPTLEPIMTLVGDGMSEGLHAFAGALCRKLGPQTASRRPICYVPVSRLQVSKKPLGYDKISYAQLVGYLAAFYRREPLAGAPAPVSSTNLRAELQAIRRGMAKDPCTLILDGFCTFESTLPRLAALMVDDGLASLLDELIHPYRGPDASRQPALAFNDNRFIVLAASPVRFDSPFAVSASPLDHPDPETMEAIAQEQDRSQEMVKAAKTMAAEKTDVALALVQMLVEHGDPDKIAATMHITTESDLAREVLGILRPSPVTLAVMACAALMPDGVRVATLNRVLGAWREAWRETALEDPSWDLCAALEPPVGPPAPLSIAIDNAIKVLEPLLARGQDGSIQGLDTLDHARERLEFATARRREDSEFPTGNDSFDCTYLDFTAPRLRNLLTEHLIETPSDHPAVARLHRLLGEEMLLQYNLIARHGDWRDADDIRFFRRLFQAIYHGACSLELGPGETDPGLHGLSFRALPAQNSIGFVRYYAVFYRALLEAPPEWHLSRTQGRDDIKVDLLRLMMNVGAGDPWAFLSDKTLLSTRISPFLTVDRDAVEAEAAALANGARPDLDAGNIETRLTLISDQLTSLAKAALRNNELNLVAEAIKVSRELFKVWPDAEAFGARRLMTTSAETDDDKAKAQAPDFFAWDAKRRAQLAITRTEIDLDIVRGEKRLDRRAKTVLIKEFGFEEDWLKLFENPPITLNTPNFGKAVESWLNDFQKQVAPKLVSARGLSETLSAWSDLLGSLAETYVIEAGDMAATHPRRQPLFMQAFLLLAAADRLRRSAFAFSPLARDFHINPHGARVLVRGLLQLIKAARYGPRPTEDATIQYLVSQARRQMDMLGRLVARYPTEKPSLLILDAAFARQAGNDALGDLKVAERLLAEADDLMGAAAHRPRVRLRLMRERAKVYRGIAMLTEGKVQKTYAALAYLEIDRLYRLAHHGNLKFWESIARRQRSKMNGLASLKTLPAADIPGLLDLKGN